MKTLKKITFLIEEFAVRSPAQQLLDRFLIGYPRDGEIHHSEGCQVAVQLAGDNAELDRRVKDFGLVRETDPAKATAGADALVVVPKDSGAAANENLIRTALENASKDSACFVYGALAASLDGARKLNELARARKIPLLAGTSLPITWRLPEVDLAEGAAVQEGLIVVQGEALAAELDGLEGLLPVLERRRGGESGVRSVRFWKGPDFSDARERGLWSWKLLTAAISRSNSPQGNALKDGRTEDLSSLGLIEKLARDPRGWVIEHSDGVKSTVLVLDGVIADYNFAVLARDRTLVSAQIYRPPAPAEHHFSRLAAVMEDFFRSSKPPWSVDRSLLIAGLLEVFKKFSGRSGETLETPELAKISDARVP
jgi:hypothetical protein